MHHPSGALTGVNTGPDPPRKPQPLNSLQKSQSGKATDLVSDYSLGLNKAVEAKLIALARSATINTVARATVMGRLRIPILLHSIRSKRGNLFPGDHECYDEELIAMVLVE